MADLTPAQGRILDHLDAYPRWHTLLELDLVYALERDDVVCVPSLIERKLVQYLAVAGGAVAITPAGQVLAPRNRPP